MAGMTTREGRWVRMKILKVDPTAPVVQIYKHG